MNLFEARAKRRAKQWDIAKKAGISQSKFSLIERGCIQSSDDEKTKIAEALGFEVSDIEWVTREGEAERKKGPGMTKNPFIKWRGFYCRKIVVLASSLKTTLR